MGKLEQTAAPALAEFKLPEIDRNLVEEALDTTFSRGRADPRAIQELQSLVSELSGGKVRLEFANPDDFPFRVKGAISYLALVGDDGARQLLIYGPYDPPFEFIENKA